MRTSIIGILAIGLAGLIWGGSPGSNGTGWTLINEAHAIVGRPITPVSVAGVARRTTRRMIYRTTIYVATLPTTSCTRVVIEGTSLYLCGTTYYEPYGNEYVVVDLR
jgi:hypothetical protein